MQTKVPTRKLIPLIKIDKTTFAILNYSFKI